MDRVAAMLHRELAGRYGSRFAPTLACPAYAARASRAPGIGRTRLAANLDRFVNRFWDYPRHLAPMAGAFDLFHIIDHSYAQLAHALPAERTIVTCHDLDAFRSIVEPEREPRSRPFRWATRRILTGLQRAACVTFDTAATRKEMIARGLVREENTVVAPPGVDDIFRAQPDGAAAAEAERLAPGGDSAGSPGSPGSVDVVHVGSTIPRKRIDVLLRVCGALRHTPPSLRLLRVGGPLTADQVSIAHAAGIADRVVNIGYVSDATLAALYRRAAVVLQTSEREGFGLPVVEAIAAGTPVVASGIEALREVGGDAVEYCGVADLDAWTRTVDALLRERYSDASRWNARRDRGRARAEAFTWSAFADRVVAVYDSLLAGAARRIA